MFHTWQRRWRLLRPHRRWLLLYHATNSIIVLQDAFRKYKHPVWERFRYVARVRRGYPLQKLQSRITRAVTNSLLYHRLPSPFASISKLRVLGVKTSSISIATMTGNEYEDCMVLSFFFSYHNRIIIIPFVLSTARWIDHTTTNITYVL